MNALRRVLSTGKRSDAAGVHGERGPPVVNQAPSVQSLVSNGLAMGLMLTVGAVVLAWYYLHIAGHQSQIRRSAQSATRNRAEAEMALPALGPISAPQFVASSNVPAIADQASSENAGAALNTGLPLPPGPYAVYGATSPKSLATAPASGLARRLSGAAFVREGPQGASGAHPPDAGGAVIDEPAPSAAPDASAAPAAYVAPSAIRTPTGDSGLAPLLHGDFAGTVVAHTLRAQRLLLPKGAFIDCTLETAIDSTLPGMTTCVTATDTFGIDGKVILLERGTKLVGETRGQVQQGSARVFVLWTEARTPTGVIVPLDSPGADQLGRSGLPGSVARHFWERFGAALVISTIDGAVQAGVQASSRGNGTIIYNPSATQDVMTESLKSTVNIPPTVIKRNGDRIQVLVARDIDFTSVYELRRVTIQP
ncbi:MAG: type IV secretion system protein VirB10 [Steroidobacteraceae bacterium]|jgi:type IV secretion system protein VirB10